MSDIQRALWGVAPVILSVLIGTACGSGSAEPSGENAPDLTPDDVLAAALSPKDVHGLFPDGPNWWPFFPEFNVGFSPLKTGPMDNSRFFIVQSYQQVGGDGGLVQTVLNLYDSAARASEALPLFADANDEGGEAVDGPDVGDQSLYFTRRAADDALTPPFETTLRYRVGPILGRISVFSPEQFEDPDVLVMYAEPVVKRLRDLLDGDLAAGSLPDEFTELLPPESGVDSLGSAFGTALAPIESWALIDTTGDPQQVREHLRDLGATQLVLRRYGLEGDPEQVVEITLFVFENEDGPSDWVKEFIPLVRQEEALQAGNTGRVSAYGLFDDSIYELQFAKGRYAADVACFAPFGETSSACEDPVRELAELWYEALPAE